MALFPIEDPTWRECVAQHRLRAGKTKKELGELCGLSRTTLYRIESGRYDPSEEQIAKIENALLSLTAVDA